MGSGKTTVGKKLSSLTGLPVLDLDEKIEKETKMKIRVIFEQFGEGYFRKLESKVLHDTAHLEGIITTGGGVIVTKENRKFLKQNNTVFLHCDPKILYERISKDPTRPLAKNKDMDEIIAMYEERLPFYNECATYTVDTTHKTIEEITEWIRNKMNF